MLTGLAKLVITTSVITKTMGHSKSVRYNWHIFSFVDFRTVSLGDFPHVDTVLAKLSKTTMPYAEHQ